MKSKFFLFLLVFNILVFPIIANYNLDYNVMTLRNDKNLNAIERSSIPNIVLQWKYNSTYNEPLNISYFPNENFTQSFNCSIYPEIYLDRLMSIDNNSVSIISNKSLGEVYQLSTILNINFSYPSNYIIENISSIKLDVNSFLNSSVDLAKIQIYDFVAENYISKSNLSTTKENNSIIIIDDISNYINNTGNSNFNFNLKFYIENTSGIELNYTIDAILLTITYNIIRFNRIYKISTGDINNDGNKEIAFLDEMHNIKVLDGITGELNWSFSLPNKVFCLDFGDVNFDGNDNLITISRLSGASNTYSDNITAFDIENNKSIIGYQMPYRSSAFQIEELGVGDMNNDNKEEIIFIDSIGTLYMIDGEDGDLIWNLNGALKSFVPFESGKKHGFDIELGNIDVDENLELAIAGRSNDGYGIIKVFNWKENKGELLWEFETSTSAYLANTAFGDIDNDNFNEIAVGSRRKGVIDGGKVYLFENATNTTIWNIDLNTTNIFDISFGDINFDNKDELIVGTGGVIINSTYILNGSDGSILWQYESKYEINSVELSDLDGDNNCEIIIASDTGIEVFWIDFNNNGISDLIDLDDDSDGIPDEVELNYYFTNKFSSDTDFDNLSDLFEINITLTDPRLWDTDYDNLSDYQECYKYYTNPRDPNSDHDYLTDYEDILMGLDPNDPDSDDDGYLDGAFLNDTDMDNLTDLFEIINGINPFNSDSDSDGLTDWEELFRYFTYANNSNTDNDYLSDYEEIQLGLDPLNPDSNNDGYLDGQTIPPFYLYIVLWILIISIIVSISINLRHSYQILKGKSISKKEDELKNKPLLDRINDALNGWEHQEQVVKNFSNLLSKSPNNITLNKLTRTWTQHYFNHFKMIYGLSKEEANDKALTKKVDDIKELYEKLKDTLKIKITKIKFGKYTGSLSYKIMIEEDIDILEK